MTRVLLVACICISFVLTTAGSLHAELTAENVNKSIERAVNFLKRQQRNRGNWDPTRHYEGGATALCTLALLEAGTREEEKRESMADWTTMTKASSVPTC